MLKFLKKNLGSSHDLSANQTANRRISLFTVMVIALMIMGVMGLYPNNSLDLMKPFNGLICYFALFCVGFTAINLFNKEKVPGEKEFSNSHHFFMLFTLGID